MGWIHSSLLSNSHCIFSLLDFEMSDAQLEHALAIERLAPEFAAMKAELCPSQMTEGCFWKIYFVLLHSRLNVHDAEFLSTSQVNLVYTHSFCLFCFPFGFRSHFMDESRIPK